MADTKSNRYAISVRSIALTSLAACFLFICGPVFAADYYVSTTGSDDANGLSWETAFATIQKAIDEANDTDSVTVQTGLYSETIDFKGKSITVKSTYPNDWYMVESTIIDANDGEYVVKFINSEDANSVLTGFTVQNGYYGIYCSSGSCPAISRCVIEENAKAAYLAGSAVLINNKVRENTEGIIFAGSSNAEIENNFLYDSLYGALCLDTENSPLIKSQTIINQSLYGVLVYPDANIPQITNCILWNNKDNLKDCSATYSCIEDPNDASGTGNITTNPGFADANNYHISPNSVCIDIGDTNLTYDANATDVDNEPRFFDGDGNSTVIIDMGADEYEYKLTDFNNDGKVNFIDYSLFASAWQTTPNDVNDYNDIYDLQDNNSIDYNDLAIFVEDWAWQAGWTTPMSYGSGEYYESMMMGGGGGMMMSAPMSMSAETLSAKEVEPVTIEPIDVREMVEWLIKMYEEDEEFREAISEEDMKDFIGVLLQELQ